MAADLDLLVVGSGVAGLSAAVDASARGLRVGVLTKGMLDQATTRWAQGGVAAVLGGDPDSTDLHLADTLAAGAGLCQVAAVRILVDEGPARVNQLIAWGASFDREAGGGLALAREGGHSVARVVHAGGAATGAEIERALVEAVQATAAAVLEGWFAVDLVVEGGRCRGVRALDAADRLTEVRAAHVLLASGGGGQLFSVTTNPAEATGDGVAMALRAGVAVADLEFVQFHPTALHHPQMPRPLLSEALRGHGAMLRDHAGDRFVDELAPRDVVSAAMTARMAAQGVEHLWLDATPLEDFSRRFPTLGAALAAAGLDPARDWLPIAPAAHYTIGGVLTDLDGATTLGGLWAAGEAACTGVHGANRLGSNSLLEGMVFSARVVEAVAAGKAAPDPSGVLEGVLDGNCTSLAIELTGPGEDDAPNPGTVGESGEALSKLRAELQASMTANAGVLRDATSLAAARHPSVALPRDLHSRDACELRNLADLRSATLVAARARTESRGAHTRTDHPRTDPDLEKRLVIR